MNNKDISPTIEQSLKMIEKEIEFQKKNKSGRENFTKNTSESVNHEKKHSPLSNLFKKNNQTEKKILKPKKKEDILLLTKKVNNKRKIVNFKIKEVLEKKSEKKVKEENKNKKEEEPDLYIKDHKNLNKTTDLAVIIKKLRNIRDKKLNNKKNSKKINKEIKKLNETIDLAEELFKKELLDL